MRLNWYRFHFRLWENSTWSIVLNDSRPQPIFPSNRNRDIAKLKSFEGIYSGDALAAQWSTNSQLPQCSGLCGPYFYCKMKGKRLAYCFNGHHRLRYENHKDFCIHFDSNQRHFISHKIELTHLCWHLATSRSSLCIAPFQHRRRLESAKYLLLSKIVKTKLQWNSFLIRRKTFKLPTSITAYTVWRE